jgi:hypothetical protein
MWDPIEDLVAPLGCKIIIKQHQILNVWEMKHGQIPINTSMESYIDLL